MNYPLRTEIFTIRARIAARHWDGTGAAPHPIKQQAIRKYAAKYGVRVLVETGTYYGDMVAAMLHDFDLIYSIELSPALHARAQRRFRRHPQST
jgi:protein-L-isoaspartate O-methyltransferase